MASMAESLDCGMSKLRVVAVATKGEYIFHPFPDLPKEIRLQIWQQAIDALPGRIIDVTSVTYRNESGHEKLDRFISYRPAPDLQVSIVKPALRSSEFIPRSFHWKENTPSSPPVWRKIRFF
jgi:hypothetical protein